MTGDLYDEWVWVLQVDPETGLQGMHATPENMLVLVQVLERAALAVQTEVEATPEPLLSAIGASDQWRRDRGLLLTEIDRYLAELDAMKRHLVDALEVGAGTQAIWDCVTLPLLGGWRASYDELPDGRLVCTGQDMRQQSRSRALISMPRTFQAEYSALAEDPNDLEGLFDDIKSASLELWQTSKDVAGETFEAAKQIARDSIEAVSRPASRILKPLAVAAGITAILLLYTKAKR